MRDVLGFETEIAAAELDGSGPNSGDQAVETERNLAQLAERVPPARAEGSQPTTLPVLKPAAEGLVHCTPTGMADHPGMPLDPALLHAGLWVADIVYRPMETALLQAARAAGCQVLHGGHIAVHQAADTLGW